ncbi:site-specific integrase [Prauserella sp. PE36]|uniref:Phage integrase family protein n=1 Tax=Amycolatopsis marina TaxID=490629 RepID=A0A1I1BI37_9PSEU|nr:MULTISPECIES: site-specific integrase [Pseudonocardiaceae]RBM18631.1 site-specific integrase [Prauserella sp. PE36]SFB49296.1 Phage integrase family protein [Amycolatopsis marina]
MPADRVVATLSGVPGWSDASAKEQAARQRGTSRVLQWLLTYPGDGWQDRWLAANADAGTEWFDTLVAADHRAPLTARNEVTRGVNWLLLSRAILPSYRFLAQYHSQTLLDRVQEIRRPDLFAQARKSTTTYPHLTGRRLVAGLRVLCKIVLHTGRDLDQLGADDVFEYRAWFMRNTGRFAGGTHEAWDLLRALDILRTDLSLRDTLRTGQRSPAELVDRYPIACRPVRDVLVRYLDERSAGLDHKSLITLSYYLAAVFWADVEQHHPGIDTLRLPPEVAEAWRGRVRFCVTRRGHQRPRRDHLGVMTRVRTLYLDIQEWATEDPAAWAAWAAPSPVRASDLKGMGKAQKKTTAAMHQRVRERLPQLPMLVDYAERHHKDQADLLDVARATPVGETFVRNGVRYRRVAYKTTSPTNSDVGSSTLPVENTATGERIDVLRGEDEAFWAWGIIETLRHTGVRLEELLEVTHLALVSYRLPDTGEVVPLLQIVPSKSNEERLLLVSPELASVLATIVTRLRAHNGNTIPLVARYDPHERTIGPPLPHLFQRTLAGKSKVISTGTVYKLLADTLTRSGICDAAGQSMNFSPHDFRRLFTTDAVTGGLPVHIVARLLGHKNINTTQAYLAVFQEELVKTYRSFLANRRALRPHEEYREPTDEEWTEFQRHFQLRKLELGECGRPYGSSCQHEHSCIRCPMLRVDPRQRGRLVEIIHNLKERIAEATMNRWLGEAQGLQVSLAEATKKLVSLDRRLERNRAGHGKDTVGLGMPVIGIPC